MVVVRERACSGSDPARGWHVPAQDEVFSPGPRVSTPHAWFVGKGGLKPLPPAFSSLLPFLFLSKALR